MCPEEALLAKTGHGLSMIVVFPVYIKQCAIELNSKSQLLTQLVPGPEPGQRDLAVEGNWLLSQQSMFPVSTSLASTLLPLLLL